MSVAHFNVTKHSSEISLIAGSNDPNLWEYSIDQLESNVLITMDTWKKKYIVLEACTSLGLDNHCRL